MARLTSGRPAALLAAVSLGAAVACAAAAAALAAHGAWGHGVGVEELPPQQLGDRSVFVQVSAVSVDGPDADQQLTFRLMDSEAGGAVGDVTYEIGASKGGAALFHDVFRSSSGTLVINLVHSDSAGVEKQASGILGLITGDTDLARVTGPHFDRGGLYQFDIRVLAAGGLAGGPDPPLEWAAGVSIADTTRHTVSDANFGEQVLEHITYYDVIEGFGYDPGTRSVSFEMPFDGGFDAVNQTSVVHEEVAFSKGFGDLMVSEVAAHVDGVLMPEGVVQVDDFGEGRRVIHLTVPKASILELYEQGRLEDGRMSFVIGPAAEDLPLATVTRNGQFKVVMDAGGGARSGHEAEIRYKFFDVFLKDRPVEVGYDLRVERGGAVLFSASGVSGGGAGGFDSARFPVPAGAPGVIHVSFENLGGNPLASARLPVVVDRADAGDPAGRIPGWVRSSAGWWADGVISDGEFVGGIGFLIGEGVVVVDGAEAAADPAARAGGGPPPGIPGWVRSSAGWWADGVISDGEFVSGIEFLIASGVIRAP